LGKAYNIINLYGSYEEMKSYWENIKRKEWEKSYNVIIGGDLNLKMKVGEMWGEFIDLIP
jgi:hypothetical protein